jgi:hypothetical protein
MIPKTLALLVGLGTFVTLAAAAEVTQVFNLPLGAELDRELPRCSKPPEPNLDFCWLKKPVPANAKNKLLILGQPDDSLPEWVAPGVTRLFIGAKGRIDAIVVDVNAGSEALAVDSISQRFGAPDSAQSSGPRRATTWRRPALAVELLCEDDKCLANFFSTAAAQSQTVKQKILSLRSATP